MAESRLAHSTWSRSLKCGLKLLTLVAVLLVPDMPFSSFVVPNHLGNQVTRWTVQAGKVGGKGSEDGGKNSKA